jgi:UPF0716 protein FxsA
LFILVPLVELYLLIELGSRIGVAATIAIVVVTGLIGAWLARSQGLRALNEVRSSLAVGEMPAEAIMDGLLILVAGAVLLTPGLLTDALGFFLLIPRGRRTMRSLARRWIFDTRDETRPDTIEVEWRREDR